MTSTRIPVVEQFQVDPRPRLLARVDELAAELKRDPRFETEDRFKPLRPTELAAGPVLCLDDFSSIRIPAYLEDVSFVMDRARLRAGSDDLIVAFQAPPPGYETYCRNILGLGRCRWLRAALAGDSRNLAQACWEDPKVFAELVEALASGRLSAIQPYMGSPAVWELAARLSKAAGRPLQVVAPHPAVALWANNKVDFALTVERLFGGSWILPATRPDQLDQIGRDVLACSYRSELVGLKVADSAGGRGNLVLPARRFLGQSPAAIQAELRPLLENIGWQAGLPVLVGAWLGDIVSALSSQIWIPLEGIPVVEGIYIQILTGESGEFMGSRPAAFSEKISRRIAERSWLLARLFQRLGYVGRCSFDMIIQGLDVESGQLIFVECNGRWGGTSLPMTLLNRLLGDSCRRPSVCRAVDLDGLERLDFGDLLKHFESELFDVRTGRGRLIFFNPGRMQARSGIEVIALGRTATEAAALLESELPEHLRPLIAPVN